MKILFLSRWFPYPADNGARLRIYNLLRQLASHHEIHLLSFTEDEVSEEQTGALSTFCADVQAVPYRGFQPNRLTALLGLFSPFPRSVLDSDSCEMHNAVRYADALENFDAVIASQVDMAPYALRVPAPRILEEIELTNLVEQTLAVNTPLKRWRKMLMWQKWKRYLAHILSQFDGASVVSECERLRLEAALPSNLGHGPISVIPNGVDLVYYTGTFGLPEPDTLLYTGALTYYANFDAMKYFLGEIFPQLQAARRNVTLSITGKLDGVPIERLPRTKGVTYTGYLGDIRPAIARSWASIVPLRIGGGTRLKILESLALGTPVIATSKGAEGLDLSPEHDILIADDSAGFANGALRLLSDADLWAHLIQHGRQTVQDRYDWRQIGQQLNDFLTETVSLASRRHSRGQS